MLLRSSSLIYPALHLITLGSTCRYAVSADDDTLTLSNPGSSAHVARLPERFAKLGLSLSDVTRVLVTSLDATKIGGIVELRRLLPKVTVIGPAPMRSAVRDESFVRALWETNQLLSTPFNLGHLPSYGEFKDALRIDSFLSEADVIELGEEVKVRCVLTPGYQQHSATYVVLPHEFLITDETFGFFRGRQLVAPGANFDLDSCVASLAKFEHLDVSGIGLPFSGAITGTLVKKHMTALAENIADIIQQVGVGLVEGVDEAEIQAQLAEAFYSSNIDDPFLKHHLSTSLESVWRQAVAKARSK